MRLSIAQAHDLARASMQAVGHTSAEADIIADHLIDCELRGLSFGGLPRALSVVERVQATPGSRRPIRVVKEGPTSAAIDGGDQVGYLVAQRATDMALEKARTQGMAVVGAYETWYTGMYSYYLEQVTRAGFVGLIAGSAPQKVAPHGGTQARFGTNPIAFGFPADPAPVIWDIGTASIMAGEVVMHARAGTPLPEGSAFDQGRPAHSRRHGVRPGRLDCLGRSQGLRPCRGRPASRYDVRSGGGPGGRQRLRLSSCSWWIPALLTSAEDYRERVAAYADSLRATRPLDPAKPVRVPFERSAAERERRRAADVVETPDETYEALVKLTEAPAPRPMPAPQTEGSAMSIDGAWNLVIKSPMGDQKSTLTAKAVGSTLRGTMSGAGGQSELENGKVEGDQVLLDGKDHQSHAAYRLSSPAQFRATTSAAT